MLHLRAELISISYNLGHKISAIENMGAARVSCIIPLNMDRYIDKMTGQRRHRSHRQRHRTARQLPTPTPSPNALPRAKPHLQHPTQPLVEHTKPAHTGPYQEQDRRAGRLGSAGGFQATGLPVIDGEPCHKQRGMCLTLLSHERLSLMVQANLSLGIGNGAG